jgi:hypothetical protein
MFQSGRKLEEEGNVKTTLNTFFLLPKVCSTDKPTPPHHGEIGSCNPGQSMCNE